MYWYNGSIVNALTIELMVNDPGLIYGANIFTTMRVHQQSLQHPLTSWQAHCDRLKQSASDFAWQQPNWQSLAQGAKIIAQRFPVLRIAIFADGRELITGRNLPEDLHQRQTAGITAWLATGEIYRRSLAQYKTGNYLGAYLARCQALKFKAQEAILSDRAGNWLETSTGNLWGKKADCWYTPSLSSGILPGIARSRLLNHLQTHGILVIENIWTEEFVHSLDHVCYSNCLVKLVPIKEVLTVGNCLNYKVANLGQIIPAI